MPATTDLRRPQVAAPLWTAAALSIVVHALLLAALASALSSLARLGEFTGTLSADLPLQAMLVPRAAPPAEAPSLPEPAIEASPPPPPAAAPVAPSPPTAALPASPPAGSAGTSHRLAPPPLEGGDIAVGATIDPLRFGIVTAARLATRFPVRPGRLPRLARPLTVVYPEGALRERSGAHVDVLLLLDEKGAVVETLLEPDDPIFGPAVRDALAGATFAPALAADTPLPYWIALEFVFTVEPATAAAAKPN